MSKPEMEELSTAMSKSPLLSHLYKKLWEKRKNVQGSLVIREHTTLNPNPTTFYGLWIDPDKMDLKKLDYKGQNIRILKDSHFYFLLSTDPVLVEQALNQIYELKNPFA